jgi:hypothetical protein
MKVAFYKDTQFVQGTVWLRDERRDDELGFVWGGLTLKAKDVHREEIVLDSWQIDRTPYVDPVISEVKYFTQRKRYGKLVKKFNGYICPTFAYE